VIPHRRKGRRIPDVGSNPKSGHRVDQTPNSWSAGFLVDISNFENGAWSSVSSRTNTRGQSDRSVRRTTSDSNSLDWRTRSTPRPAEATQSRSELLESTGAVSQPTETVGLISELQPEPSVSHTPVFQTRPVRNRKPPDKYGDWVQQQVVWKCQDIESESFI
jgi:hypothetical protein